MYRRRKYNNIKVMKDNIEFDSIKESRRYQELKLLEKANEINSLKLQPKYTLTEKYKDSNTGKTIRKSCYIADFSYKDKNGNLIVEDVKGFKTNVYKLKKKLMHTLHNIDIKEI